MRYSAATNPLPFGHRASVAGGADAPAAVSSAPVVRGTEEPAVVSLAVVARGPDARDPEARALVPGAVSAAAPGASAARTAAPSAAPEAPGAEAPGAETPGAVSRAPGAGTHGQANRFQRRPIAVANLLNNPNRKVFAAETGNVLVPRETRAVPAAMAPTGAIANGREAPAVIASAHSATVDDVLPETLASAGDHDVQVLKRLVLSAFSHTVKSFEHTIKRFDQLKRVRDHMPAVMAKNVELEASIVGLTTRLSEQDRRISVLEKRRTVESTDENDKSATETTYKKHKTREVCTRRSHPEMDWQMYTTFSKGRWGYKRALPKIAGETLKYIEKHGFDSNTEAIAAMERRYTAMGYENRIDAWLPAVSSASGAGPSGV